MSAMALDGGDDCSQGCEYEQSGSDISDHGSQRQSGILKSEFRSAGYSCQESRARPDHARAVARKGLEQLGDYKMDQQQPGGSDDHWAVAHYGTDPQNLNQMAKSHIRLNQAHPDTVFRVRVLGLKPGTT
jgi:hypothetical protein